MAILRTSVVSRFTCLGDRCEDTCCQKWSMQVDEPTLTRYKKEAPELLDAVEASDEAPWIMRKDKQTGFCVKLEGGLCGIHRQYGSAFLSDACYFYPRVTRALGEQVIMSATMSCPEIARLALEDVQPSMSQSAEVERLPHTIKNYAPEGMDDASAVAVHESFLQATQDEAASAEQIFLRIASASRSLERIDKKSWAAMASFYLQHADMRVPPASTDIADAFNLLHALCGLIVASRKAPSERLLQTITDMEHALHVRLDWEQVQIEPQGDSVTAWGDVRDMWRRDSARYAPLLKRWLQMQLSSSLYPFAGLGNTLSERITIIGVRMATIKLALMCAHAMHQTILTAEHVVRIVQTISRILDHLADPAFSLQIYQETGWTEEKRMRGLIEM